MLKFTFGEERIEMDAAALWPIIEQQVTELQQTQPTMAFLLKGFLSTVVFPGITKAMSRPGARIAPPNFSSPQAKQNMLLYMVGYIFMLLMTAGEATTWDILYDVEERDDGPVTVITGLASPVPAMEAALEALVGGESAAALPAAGDTTDEL